MDEDPLGPRHGVAGGPVRYKHRMRGEVWGLGQWRDVAEGKGTSRGGESRGTGEIGQQTPSNRPLGLRSQSPWSGEPWVNHREPGHRKSGTCPESRDGRQVSAGMRADPEAPRSRARVQVGSRVSGTLGNMEQVAPWLPAADGRHPSTSGSRVGTPVRDGWGSVECG